MSCGHLRGIFPCLRVKLVMPVYMWHILIVHILTHVALCALIIILIKNFISFIIIDKNNKKFIFTASASTIKKKKLEPKLIFCGKIKLTYNMIWIFTFIRDYGNNESIFKISSAIVLFIDVAFEYPGMYLRIFQPTEANDSKLIKVRMLV